MTNFERIGVRVPDVLLPEPECFRTWPVIACDQFSAEPGYWEETKAIVGDAPSALKLIIPEAMLEEYIKRGMVEEIYAYMRRYLEDGTLKSVGEGFVYVKRQTKGGIRHGLMALIDLEMYDYNGGSKSLIRASEGTIPERVPPRVAIRKGAPLEMPHSMLLFNDSKDMVFTIVKKAAEEIKPLYDFDLIQGGGHIEGRLLPAEHNESIAAAFEALLADNGGSMLFAVGDGNHSLAAAKESFLELKAELGEAALSHPARFTLTELVNIHDESLCFKPIHRVLFGVKTIGCVQSLVTLMRNHGNKQVYSAWYTSHADMESAASGIKDGAHVYRLVTEDFYGLLWVEEPVAMSPVKTIQDALDNYLSGTGAAIDYVHGDNAAMSIGAADGNIGILLSSVDKSGLFEAIEKDGALPRKAFSIGEAKDKRYYLECRKLCR